DRALVQLDSPVALSGSIPIYVSCAIKPVPILDWLRQTTTQPRVYWSSRDGELEIGGSGTALTVAADDTKQFPAAFAKMSAILSTQPQDSLIRFIGGSSFDPQDSRNGRFQRYRSLWFFLPQIILTRCGENHYLSACIMVDRDSDRQAVKQELLEQLESGLALSLDGNRLPLIGYSERHDSPDRDGWDDMVETALGQIKEGAIEKVVLARRTDLEFTQSISPFSLLDSIRDAASSCFHFLLQPENSVAFIGASPERLFKVENDRFHTEALAGTIVRGRNETEEKSNREKLATGSKERREHRYVVKAVIQVLADLCNDISSTGQPEVLTLANVHHLLTPISGRLKSETTIGDVLKALHPTPAVCGTPRRQAQELIRKLEPFGRGWYAGPVGYIGRQQSEFAVAIRSALIDQERVSLFAGAGIVSGSVAEQEWQELEQKMATMMNLFPKNRC
ncbi:MAG: isochorismate synthase, partial [candidate division Zixibacteria bacterium]|nr:isochorismate synthase [candidate division Zixibacteria bacterium]